MPFTGTFTKTDTSATAYNSFDLEDTSDYTDEPENTFTDRQVYLVYVDGSYVDNNGLDYFDWPFVDGSTKSFDVLTEDAAVSIMVVWTSSDPQVGSTYSAVTVDDFVDYAEEFMYTKVYQLAGNRNLISNKNFKTTLDITRTLIDSSATCIVFTDQYSSQRCIDNVVTIEDNPNMFY